MLKTMKMSKKVILGAILGFLGLICLVSAGKMYEDIDAGEIVVIQDPVDGELHVYTQPEMVWQGWGKATHYKKSNTFWFSAPTEKDGPDKSIPVKWNDGGHATISGSVRYDLPTDYKQMVALHSTFGSQEAIEYAGEMLGLFDPDFSGNDEKQSFGYHAFKQLVNLEGELPPNANLKRILVQNGDYLLHILHPTIREIALKYAKAIRNGTLIVPVFTK